MSATEILTIHTDGAARGNPGPAAFAYVIEYNDLPPIEEAGCLGRMTNNQAEYIALVRALEHAARLGAELQVVVHSDSELMVKQMRGEYRVKNEDLRDLFEQAQTLRRRFSSVTFHHVRRAQNSRADQLCNDALDGRRGPTEAPKSQPSSPSARGASRSARTASLKRDSHPTQVDPRREIAKEQAVACLRGVAAAWAKGNPEDPPPEEVWEQLYSILEDQRLLRRPRPHS